MSPPKRRFSPPAFLAFCSRELLGQEASDDYSPPIPLEKNTTSLFALERLRLLLAGVLLFEQKEDSRVFPKPVAQTADFRSSSPASRAASMRAFGAKSRKY